MEKYIVHADMDAFFASVEQRDNPLYKGKPLIVGADPMKGKGRGVVAACSYEARKFGIQSAMPISAAYRRCPKAIFLRPDMEKYSCVSRQIFNIFEDFTPDIEPVSIDEAFLDITGSWHLFGTPESTCELIKKTVKHKTGLTVSLGMAPNKTTAKIASDIGKPDGFVPVNKDKILDFLHPLSVKKLWGIGEKTSDEMKKLNILTIGDLANFPREDIYNIFGVNGLHARDLANGIDPRTVNYGEEALSVSNEHTFNEDTKDIDRIKDILMHLSEKVSIRLRNDNLSGRSIGLKIRFADFKTYTRSLSIYPATNLAEDIYKEILSLLENFSQEQKPIRLLGVKVSKLGAVGENQDLFGSISSKGKKQDNIQKALDTILGKYGEGAIRRRK